MIEVSFHPFSPQASCVLVGTCMLVDFCVYRALKRDSASYARFLRQQKKLNVKLKFEAWKGGTMSSWTMVDRDRSRIASE